MDTTTSQSPSSSPSPTYTPTWHGEVVSSAPPHLPPHPATPTAATTTTTLMYKSLSNITIPSEFKYRVMLSLTSSKITLLSRIQPLNLRYYRTDDEISSINLFSPGVYTFGKVTVWVDLVQCIIDTSSPMYMMCYLSEEDEDQLIQAILDQVQAKEKKAVYKMYRYNGSYQQWEFDQDYLPKDQSDLLGLDKIMESLDDDVKMMKDPAVNKFLKSKGIHQSLNYVLCGCVGTGEQTHTTYRS